MTITGTIDPNFAGITVDVTNTCIDLPASLVNMTNVSQSRNANCPTTSTTSTSSSPSITSTLSTSTNPSANPTFSNPSSTLTTATSSNTTSAPPDNGSAGGSSVPILPLALGIVGGVVVIALAVIAALLIRRSRRKGADGESSNQSNANAHAAEPFIKPLPPPNQPAAFLLTNASQGTPPALTTTAGAPTTIESLSTAPAVFFAAASASSAGSTQSAGLPASPVRLSGPLFGGLGDDPNKVVVFGNEKVHAVALADVSLIDSPKQDVKKDEAKMGPVPPPRTSVSVLGDTKGPATITLAPAPVSPTSGSGITPPPRTVTASTRTAWSGSGGRAGAVADSNWLVQVSRWTPVQVRDHLIGMGIGSGPARLLEDCGVDGYQLLLLTHDRLVSLGVREANARALVLFAAERVRQGPMAGVEDPRGDMAPPMYE
ncbi:hypothetical protein HDU96_009860 [Phlyctochytrium bullatum]|nr:hypothetical protein HDU96_009860 [Phlyctochytrium bullatum]